MEIQKQINEIKNTLANGDTNKAINYLRILVQGNSFLDEVLVLSSRENKLKRQLRKKIIYKEAANIEENQINFSILQEFENELNDKNHAEETNSDSNYTRSIINLGRDIQNGHSKINSKEDSLRLSDLLTKISNLLELKIKRIESGDDLNNTLGELELYKDYLPTVLDKSKKFINETLTQKILERINEAYRKKAEYIISINEAKLYDTSNKEMLIRDLKIASGYFEQTAEILKL